MIYMLVGCGHATREIGSSVSAVGKVGQDYLLATPRRPGVVEVIDADVAPTAAVRGVAA